MKQSDKVLILGSRGMVGSAILRELKNNQYTNLFHPTRKELNLLNQADVLNYFKTHKPDHVFLAAARVGGIHANNTYRADFILENLIIQSNVFQASFENKVQKFLFLGSSCIYPKNAPQPIKEEYLLSGPLEQTNEPYAIAKIAGLKTAENIRRQYGCQYFSVMPTNLYGVNDNFDPENAHVAPGLIARMTKAMDEKASEFVVWGTGYPKREFLYVDDMAKACVHVMQYQGEIPDLINIGTGEDVTIRELAEKIKKLLGFKGNLVFNPDRPDGPMRKLLDVSRIHAMGWKHEISLDEGLKRTIEFYLESLIF
jgi:GDP-L-fucose synthase